MGKLPEGRSVPKDKPPSLRIAGNHLEFLDATGEVLARFEDTPLT